MPVVFYPKSTLITGKVSVVCVTGVTPSCCPTMFNQSLSRTRHQSCVFFFLYNLMLFSNASKALEKESGLRAEQDDCTGRMLSCVSSGRWKEALDLLSSVQVK